MTGLMDDALGVGLAATQLGVMHRLLVYRVGLTHRWWRSSTRGSSGPLRAGAAEEGCLSLPGVAVDVERPVHVRVGARRTSIGDAIVIEASGLEARVLQHEMDHLDGVLILDRTDKEQRKEALRTLREGRPSRPCARAARSVPPDPSRSTRAHRLHGHIRVRGGRAEGAGRVTRTYLGWWSPRPTGPRDGGRRMAPPPAADAARELGIDAAPGAERERRGGAGGDRRGRAGAICVCEFGQLIKEPLLSRPPDPERASVAAAALAGGGADRARADGGRRGDRRHDLQDRRRPRLAVRWRCRAARADRSRTTRRGRCRRASRSSAATLLVEALDRAEAGTLELIEQPRRASPTPTRSTRRSGGWTRAPGGELERVVRALTPHVGRLPRVRGRRAARRRIGARGAESLPPGELVQAGRAPARRLRRGCARAARGAAAGQAHDGRAGVPARARRSCACRPSASPASAATPARRCAFEVVRRVFEQRRLRRHGVPCRGRRHGLAAATARSRCSSSTGPCSAGRRSTI